MDATATMTSKGQMTIPKAIRDALGLQPGDRVTLTLEDDGTVRLSARTVPLDKMFGMLRREGQRALSIEEMHAAVAEAAIEKVGLRRRSRAVARR